jgi:hypothetical protein
VRRQLAAASTSTSSGDSPPRVTEWGQAGLKSRVHVRFPVEVRRIKRYIEAKQREAAAATAAAGEGEGGAGALPATITVLHVCMRALGVALQQIPEVGVVWVLSVSRWGMSAKRALSLYVCGLLLLLLHTCVSHDRHLSHPPTSTAPPPPPTQLNGHRVLGHFYPSPTADVSCELRLRDGTYALLKVPAADARPVGEIARLLELKRQALAQGRDPHYRRRQLLLRWCPPPVLPALEATLAFLGAGLGLAVPLLGVRAFPQGGCVVLTSPAVSATNKGFTCESDFVVEPEPTAAAGFLTPMVLTIGAITSIPKVRVGLCVVVGAVGVVCAPLPP